MCLNIFINIFLVLTNIRLATLFKIQTKQLIVCIFQPKNYMINLINVDMEKR